MSKRNLLLKCALLAAFAGAALLASPRFFVQRVYATVAGCEAKCNNGSCSSDPEDNETCTCGCSFFGAAKCTCQQVPAVAPVTPG